MNQTPLQRAKETNRLKADKALERRREYEAKDASLATQEIILKSFRSLVAYLDNPQRVTKTSIVNQLNKIGTPDAFKVVEAIKDLHTTVKTHENTDLSEVASLLKGVLAEAKLIPKSHKDISIPDPIDNTKQFASLEAAIKAVDKSIKAQKLVAEAPVINLPETKVEAPDLSPIKDEQVKTRKELVKALKALVFPTTDTKPMEKELKKLNKLFNEFLDSVPAGSGGGGGVVSFIDTNGNASPVTKESDGSIPVTIIAGGSGGSSTRWALYEDAGSDLSGDPMYFGKEKADGSWVIKQFGITSTRTKYFEGTGGISTNWAGRAGYTYVEFKDL